MDKILSLLTKENITFLIAVLGFLLSLYNFLNEILQNRMKLHITYKNHLISEHNHMGITISMSIENKVKVPPLLVMRNCFLRKPQLLFIAIKE